MHSWFLSRRGLLVSLVLLLVLGALLGCSAGGEPSPSASETLRARFPEQVKQVLEAGAGFVATGEGFVSRPREAVPGGFRLAGEKLETVLSVKSEEGLVFKGPRGFAPRVREVGAMGEGTLEGTAVSY